MRTMTMGVGREIGRWRSTSSALSTTESMIINAARRIPVRRSSRTMMTSFSGMRFGKVR